MGARRAVIFGMPDHGHISTSHTYTSEGTAVLQLTNGLSKKVENHEALRFITCTTTAPGFAKLYA